MKTSLSIFLTVLLVVMTGCSDNEKPGSSKTIIDDQLRAMEKAKEVEKTLEEAAQQQRKNIDEQSR